MAAPAGLPTPPSPTRPRHPMQGRAKASKSARWRFSEPIAPLPACLLGGNMLTTVYFATNRTLAGLPEDWRSYGTGIVAPSDPAAITYATAFVDNTNLTADTTGAITLI